MNRDEIAVSLLPTMLAGAEGLGQLEESKRRIIFATLAKIAYEISDAMIEASKPQEKG